MACAVTAAERGHEVTLFDAAAEIGGQFNLARRIPGKEEFAETLRYLQGAARQAGNWPSLRVEPARRRRGAARLRRSDPRDGNRAADGRRFRGLDHSMVAGYVEIVEGRRLAGRRVAIVGAGGIGFDVAELLSAGEPADGDALDGRSDDPAIAAFRDEWGIDGQLRASWRTEDRRAKTRHQEELWLLQRKASKVGEGLGKNTGWIPPHAAPSRRGVKMLAGVEYVNWYR